MLCRIEEQIESRDMNEASECGLPHHLLVPRWLVYWCIQSFNQILKLDSFQVQKFQRRWRKLCSSGGSHWCCTRRDWGWRRWRPPHVSVRPTPPFFCSWNFRSSCYIIGYVMLINLHLIANPLDFHLIERLISTCMEKGTIPEALILIPIGYI